MSCGEAKGKQKYPLPTFPESTFVASRDSRPQVEASGQVSRTLSQKVRVCFSQERFFHCFRSIVPKMEYTLATKDRQSGTSPVYSALGVQLESTGQGAPQL